MPSVAASTKWKRKLEAGLTRLKHSHVSLHKQCHHGLDDTVDSFRVDAGPARGQVHRHEVPPVDGRRGVGDLLQSCFIYVPGRGHHEQLDALVAGRLCCHLNAPARVSSHMSVSYNHSKSQGLGGRGCAQHFLSHVGEGAVDVGTLAQVHDSIDSL